MRIARNMGNVKPSAYKILRTKYANKMFNLKPMPMT